MIIYIFFIFPGVCTKVRRWFSSLLLTCCTLHVVIIPPPPGLGINLTSADTVILHDVDFNPEVSETVVLMLDLN